MLALIMAWSAGINMSLSMHEAINSHADTAVMYGAFGVMWSVWAWVYYQRDLDDHDDEELDDA